MSLCPLFVVCLCVYVAHSPSPFFFPSFQNSAVLELVDNRLKKVAVSRNGFCAVSSVCWPTPINTVWELLLSPFVHGNPGILEAFPRGARTRKPPTVLSLEEDAMKGVTHHWFPSQFVASFLAWRGVCAIVLDRRPSVRQKVTLRGTPWDKAQYVRVVEYRAAENHFYAYKEPRSPKAVYQFGRTDTITKELGAILTSEMAVWRRGFHYANGRH